MRAPGAPILQPSDPVNGYSVYAIGPVVFWLWGHSLTGGPYIEARSDDAHQLIWPALGGDVHWPPRSTLQAEAELLELAHRTNLADSTRWPHGYPNSRTSLSDGRCPPLIRFVKRHPPAGKPCGVVRIESGWLHRWSGPVRVWAGGWTSRSALISTRTHFPPACLLHRGQRVLGLGQRSRADVDGVATHPRRQVEHLRECRRMHHKLDRGRRWLHCDELGVDLAWAPSRNSSAGADPSRIS
jgi:hypothetical protein